MAIKGQPRRAAPKSTAKQMDERLHVVRNLLLRGYERSVITRDLSRQWNVAARTIRQYLTTVLDDWKASEAEVDPVLERSRARQQLEECYRQALEKGDHRACAHLIKTRLAMIPGGIAPVSVQIAGEVGVRMSPAEAAREIEEAAQLLELAKRRGFISNGHHQNGTAR
jgi:hypothetical protein